MEYELPEIIPDEIFTLVSGTPDGPPDSSALPMVYEAFDGRVVMAVFRGVISASNADNFSPSLQQMLNAEVGQVILSLKDVTKLSHTAVGILVDFAAGVLGRGKELYLFKTPPYIEQRLIELNVGVFFKLLRNEDELFSIFPID